MRGVFATALFCLLVLACNNCSENNGQDSKPYPSAINSLEYDTLIADKQWGDCENNEFNCVTVNLIYPHFKRDDSLGTALNFYVEYWLMGELKDSFATAAQLMDWYITEYQRIRQQQNDYTTGWQIEKVISVVVNENGIISLRYDNAESTGGAHPNTLTLFVNFDLDDHKKLALHDLLVPGFEDTLNRLAEHYFFQSKELGDGDRSKAGFNFKDNAFELNQNFLIDEAGLSFVFNKLEIDPGSTGLSEFTIPYSELIRKGLIRKQGPLGFMLSDLQAVGEK